MADLSGTDANHVFAPGYAPKEPNLIMESLTETLVVTGPAILILLIIYVVFRKLQELKMEKHGDALSENKRREIAEKQALKAAETREAVQNLRKQRQQKTRTT